MLCFYKSSIPCCVCSEERLDNDRQKRWREEELTAVTSWIAAIVFWSSVSSVRTELPDCSGSTTCSSPSYMWGCSQTSSVPTLTTGTLTLPWWTERRQKTQEHLPGDDFLSLWAQEALREGWCWQQRDSQCESTSRNWQEPKQLDHELGFIQVLLCIQSLNALTHGKSFLPLLTGSLEKAAQKD